MEFLDHGLVSRIMGFWPFGSAQQAVPKSAHRIDVFTLSGTVQSRASILAQGDREVIDCSQSSSPIVVLNGKSPMFLGIVGPFQFDVRSLAPNNYMVWSARSIDSLSVR
jgi:hypothetical protein